MSLAQAFAALSAGEFRAQSRFRDPARRADCELSYRASKADPAQSPPESERLTQGKMGFGPDQFRDLEDFVTLDDIITS